MAPAMVLAHLALVIPIVVHLPRRGRSVNSPWAMLSPTGTVRFLTTGRLLRLRRGWGGACGYSTYIYNEY